MAGKIIEKIGPILAINNEEFLNQHVVEKLIKDIPKIIKKISYHFGASNSKNVKKNYIYFAIRGVKINGESFIKFSIKKGSYSCCLFKKLQIIKIKKFL